MNQIPVLMSLIPALLTSHFDVAANVAARAVCFSCDVDGSSPEVSRTPYAAPHRDASFHIAAFECGNCFSRIAASP